MIYCKHCKKAWPQGTVFCGSCGGSLGKRICENGHENLLQSGHCTTCGSRKLSRGARSSNLRPLTGLIAIGGLVSIAPLLLSKVSLGLTWAFQSVINLLAPIFVSLAILSFFLAPILGEKEGKIIAGLWVGLIKAVVSFPILVVQLLLRTKSR